MHTQRPIPATIAAVIRDGQVLLVRRANPPDQGRWAFRAARSRWANASRTRRARAVRETGVTAEPLTVFDAVDVFDHDADGLLRRHYILVAVLCRWISGEPVAGDDASQARWVPLAELDAQALALSFGVADVARKAAALAG